LRHSIAPEIGRPRTAIIIPPVLFVLSLTALVIEHRFSTSQNVIYDISASALWECIYSFALTLAVVVGFRHPGQWFRMTVIIGGIFIFGIFLSVVSVVPMLWAAMHLNNFTLATRQWIAFVLVNAIWILGILWGFQGFTWSVNVGDWNRTIWKRLRQPPSL